MVNELKTICDLLEGYSTEKSFEVTDATRNPDGTWRLIVKRVTPPGDTSQEVAEHADK